MKTGANKGFTYDLIHTNTIQTKHILQPSFKKGNPRKVFILVFILEKLFDLFPCSHGEIFLKPIFFFCLLQERRILTVFFSSRESLNSQVTRIHCANCTVNVKVKNDIQDNFYSSFMFRELNRKFINEEIWSNHVPQILLSH